MNEEHGIYAGVVDIARNGVDEVIRLRALNAELVEALKWIGDHDLKGCDLVVAGHMAHGFIGRARAALAKVEASK